MLQSIKVILVIAIVGSTLGCNPGPERQESGAARVVDSFVPREVALRKFQQNLTPVAQLASAYPSRDSLLAAFVRALSASDTAALAGMAVSRAEFAYLYYPTTPQGMPPYDLEPGLMWHLLRQRSERGIRRALAVYGGQRLELLSHDCGPGSSREGPEHHRRPLHTPTSRSGGARRVGPTGNADHGAKWTVQGPQLRQLTVERAPPDLRSADRRRSIRAPERVGSHERQRFGCVASARSQCFILER